MLLLCSLCESLCVFVCRADRDEATSIWCINVTVCAIPTQYHFEWLCKSIKIEKERKRETRKKAATTISLQLPKHMPTRCKFIKCINPIILIWLSTYNPFYSLQKKSSMRIHPLHVQYCRVELYGGTRARTRKHIKRINKFIWLLNS